MSPIQKRNMERMMYGISIPPARDATFAQSHPFLSYIVKKLDGKPKSFPFWYKKYPTHRHAYENRFAVPSEMLAGTNPELQRAFSFSCMSRGEKINAELGHFCERYCPEDTLKQSIPTRCIRHAITVRKARNHLLTNAHNHVMKFRMEKKEAKLERDGARLISGRIGNCRVIKRPPHLKVAV